MSVPSSELGPPTSFHASDVSPRNKGGEGVTHSPAGEGVGESQFGNSDDWRKSLALCLLCDDKVPFQLKCRPRGSKDEKSGQIRTQFYDDHFAMFFKKSKGVKERISLQENKMVVSNSINCTETVLKKTLHTRPYTNMTRSSGLLKKLMSSGSEKSPATFPLDTGISK